MIELKAVFPPVGETDQMLGTVTRFAESVALEVGGGGEGEVAVVALGGGGEGL